MQSRTTHSKQRFDDSMVVACMSSLFMLLLLTACGQSAVYAKPSAHSQSSRSLASYTSRIVERGGAPDDLAFDQQGNLIFTSASMGTVNRLNADDSVTILLHDVNAPEGIVVLSDGTMIFAEQKTNRIVSLAPGSTTPVVLRVLPGTNGTGCSEGVDGIGFDSTTNTLIVPDSPTGDVYRMNLDGTALTLLASGLSRPVGAGVDSAGNIYIADECGGAITSISPTGTITQLGGFRKPDDVVSSGPTTLFVVDLSSFVHALINVNLTTGAHTTIASQGFREPQGLIVDTHGDIFVSDDSANLIREFIPG